MTTPLPKGANTAIDTRHSPVTARVHWAHQPGWEIDAAAFALDAQGRVLSPTAVAFYHHPEALGGALRYQPGPQPEADDSGAGFVLDLAALPQGAVRIAITLVLHEAPARQQSFAGVPDLRLDLHGSEGLLATTAPDGLIAGETAVILAEIYRHGGGWKIRAVGQGFQQGLDAMAAQFGLA